MAVIANFSPEYLIIYIICEIYTIIAKEYSSLPQHL